MKQKADINGGQKINESNFWRILKSNPNEDTGMIQLLERYLIKTRGYVFRMPRPGSEVVINVSGGLDSIVAWGWLMKKFKLIVFPIHIAWGGKREELRSVKYFEKYFEKRCLKQFRKVKYIYRRFVPEEFKNIQMTKSYHPEMILEMLEKRRFTANETHFFSGTNAYSMDYALMYGEYLRLTEARNINTIFNGVTRKDGITIRSQTLTYLRMQMVAALKLWGRQDLQLASVYFEKETGMALSKSEIIRLGKRLDIPLQMTRSCYEIHRQHCGKCMACQSRKAEFARAGVADETIYIDNNFQTSLKWWLELVIKYFDFLKWKPEKKV